MRRRALLSGKVDAYFADATPVLYYIKKTRREVPDGRPADRAPRRRASRPARATRSAPKFKSAIATLYANGTMKPILAKWGLAAFALKQ